MNSHWRRSRAILPLGLLFLLPSPVHAHPGHAGPDAGSIGWGLAHPFTGLDHLLAMLAVGLWAMRLGGRSRWMLPCAFIAAMAVGGALGITGLSLPLVEPMVLSSTLALGALTAFSTRLPLGWSAAIVALSGFFHGQAHGQELPPSANGFAAVAGFLVATALLHAAGLLAGAALQRLAARRAQKIADSKVSSSKIGCI